MPIGAVFKGEEGLPADWQRVDSRIGQVNQVSDRPVVPLGVHQGTRRGDGITRRPGEIGQAEAARHPHRSAHPAGLEVHRRREQVAADGDVGQIAPLDQSER